MTVAEAQAEADRLLGRVGSRRRRPGAGRRVLEDAAEARRAGESERVQVEGEVQALLARRDFLESDVDHLEQYLVAQRERITEVAAQLTDIVQRVPGGLADMRRPLLSAAAEPDGATARSPRSATPSRRRRATGPDVEPGDADDELAEITKVAGADAGDADATTPLDAVAAKSTSRPSGPER